MHHTEPIARLDFAEGSEYAAAGARLGRVPSMIAACTFVVVLSACGTDSGSLDADNRLSVVQESATAAPAAAVLPAVSGNIVQVSATAPQLSGDAARTQPISSKRKRTSEPASSATNSVPLISPETPKPASDNSTWLQVAISDMRRPDGTYALNDDKLLFRGTSSSSERATLVMGRYGTPEAFTQANPDYAAELSHIDMSSPIRSLAAWPTLSIWDTLYLGERFGANHASGYTGNSRVRTWGYEMWIKSKAGVWRQVIRSDKKGAEAWRPNFRGEASFEAYAFDFRDEPDGSTSTRTLPAIGLDSSGSYWISHGYTGGVTVDPYDVADILVLCYSQLVMHDPKGIDDRQSARYLFAIGADWVPPRDSGITYWPGVGISRQKYVTVTPQLHVMHTMTEAELRANPPPR